MSLIQERMLSAENSAEGHGGHGPNDDPTGIGILIITALGIGVFVRVAIKQVERVKIPYTVVLLLMGLGIGALHLAQIEMRFLSNSIDTWLNLDPIVLLVLFLPPLLFGDSYVVEWHVFRRLSVQATLLAVPGVLINVILTAMVAVYLFPYNWGWPEGLLFGSLFAATDPVAVVALLKELGAPETLSVLIEGESLLNDGVAFVLFVVFEDQLTGRQSYTGDQIVAEVLKSSLIGVLFGLVAGTVALYIIQYIWSDPVLETTVTVVFAWGIFIFGDLYHVSGVLAVVTMGLMFAAQSISYVSAEVAAVMHEFWHVMEYVANTMVFVFSGIVVAQNIFQGAFRDPSAEALSGETAVIRNGTEIILAPAISGSDFGYLILLYICLNLFRVVMFCILSWPLSKTGYGFDWRIGAVSSWAGLRGAIGLVGALIVTREASCTADSPPSEDFPCLENETKTLVMFHMSGIVMLTLLVNGTTTRALVHKLGLDKQSYAARIVFEKAALRMHQHTHASIESLKRQPNYKGADWDLVWSHMPVLSDEVLAERTRSEHRSFHKCDAATLRKNLNKINRARFESTECIGDMLLAEARHRFLNLVKSAYRHQFKAGACSSWPALQTLIEAAARAQDKDDKKLNEWRDSLAHLCYIPDWYRDCWPKFLVRHNIRSLFITRHISRGYDIATSFIEAHLAVENEFQNIANFEVASLVLAESRAMVREARAFLRDVESSFDEIARHVKTSIAVQRLLKDNAQFAHGMLVNAEIDEKDFAAIETSIEKSLKQIHRRSGFLKIQTAEDIFRKAPFFEGVNQGIVDKCFRHAVKRIYLHSEKLLERGEQKSSVFLIVRGKVKVLLKMHTLKDQERSHHGSNVFRQQSKFSENGEPQEYLHKFSRSDPMSDDEDREYEDRPRSRLWSDDYSVASRLTTTSAPSVIGEIDGDSTSMDTGGNLDDSADLLLAFGGTRQTPSNSEPAIPDINHLYELGLMEHDTHKRYSSPKSSNKVVHITANSPMHAPVRPPPIPVLSSLNLKRSTSAAEGLNRILQRGTSQVARLQNYATSGSRARSKAAAAMAAVGDQVNSPFETSRRVAQSDGVSGRNGSQRVSWAQVVAEHPPSPEPMTPRDTVLDIDEVDVTNSSAQPNATQSNGAVKQFPSATNGNHQSLSKAQKFKSQFVHPVVTQSSFPPSVRVPPEMEGLNGSTEGSQVSEGHPHALLRPQSLHAFAINMDTTEDVDVEPAVSHNPLHNLLHAFELPGQTRTVPSNSHASVGSGSRATDVPNSANTSDRRHSAAVASSARAVSGVGENHGEHDAVWATLTKGDSVGEMELIAEMPVVATTVADSIVEAYEIKFDFLHNLFREQPDSQLERNLLQQAGLLAMESHYPQLLNAPYSLLKYILHHIEIVHPKGAIPEIMEKGKGILLRGKLLRAADRDLEVPLIPITVFDIPPRKPLTFSDGSVVLWVPRQSCLLAEQSATHNFRETGGVGHHHHHNHHGPYHAYHHHVHVPRVSRFRPIRPSVSSGDKHVPAYTSPRSAGSKSPRARAPTVNSVKSQATIGAWEEDVDDDDVRLTATPRARNGSFVIATQGLDEFDMLEKNRGTSPIHMSRSLRSTFSPRRIDTDSVINNQTILSALNLQNRNGNSADEEEEDVETVRLDMTGMDSLFQNEQGQSTNVTETSHAEEAAPKVARFDSGSK